MVAVIIKVLKRWSVGIMLLPWIIYFGYIWLNAFVVNRLGVFVAYIPHWGDGAAHLSYTSYMAAQSFFPTTHPLYLDYPFTYSFLADYLAAILVKLGINLFAAYQIWGGILSVLMIATIAWIMGKITNSKITGVLSLNLFLLSGGLGFLYLITDKLGITKLPKSEFFFSLLTQRDQTDIVWLNTIVGELIPQRSMLLGIPMGLGLIYFYWNTLILKKKYRKMAQVLAAVPTGLLTITHPHTLMVTTMCYVVWTLYRLIQINKNDEKIEFLKSQIIYLGITLTISLPLIAIFLLPAASSGGFFKLLPGWLASVKQENIVIFWLNNWGLYLPVAMIGTYLLNSRLRLFVTPFWIWFVVANVIKLQPFDWDNSKVFTWVWLGISVAVVRVLEIMWKNNLVSKLVSILVLGIIIFSGLIDCLKMLDTKTYQLELISNSEVLIAQEFVKISDKSSRVLTNTSHQNWVSLLTGRPIMAGYLGWLWTYGINYDDRYRDMVEIYSGSGLTKNLIRKYDLSYVVIGDREKNEFRNLNQSYFDKNYQIVLENENTRIYKVN